VGIRLKYGRSLRILEISAYQISSVFGGEKKTEVQKERHLQGRDLLRKLKGRWPVSGGFLGGNAEDFPKPRFLGADLQRAVSQRAMQLTLHPAQGSIRGEDAISENIQMRLKSHNGP